MTYWGKIDGAWFDTSTHTCTASNGCGGGGVWEIGICCAQYSIGNRRLSVEMAPNVYESDCDGYECIKING